MTDASPTATTTATTDRGYGAVDAWAMPHHQPIARRWTEDPARSHGLRLLGSDGFGGWPVERTIEEMDRNGVDIAVLSAIVEADQVLVSNEEVADCVDRWPDRFRGSVAVDPRRPMKALREIEHWVRDHGFVNIKVCPYGFGYDTRPNSKLWYPIYAKACELEVSVTIQVGHTGPLLPTEPGRPIYLDEVALTFPELVIIGAHIGWPWEEEMMMLAWKHANVHIDTSAHAPRRYPERFVNFMRKRGADKVLFGTDYPALRYDRCLPEFDALDLPDDVRRKVLSDNARRVFRLPGSAT